MVGYGAIMMSYNWINAKNTQWIESNTFDVVVSGHVVGDFYDAEIAEMTRITRNGGWIVICNSDDKFKRSAPNSELVSRGFEWFCHESVIGGIIYDYTRQVVK